MLEARSVPITPRLAGVFALDLAIEGVTKTRAVEAALSAEVLAAMGIDEGTPHPWEMEVWGDRFSRDAGTDWLMCVALAHEIAIDRNGVLSLRRY